MKILILLAIVVGAVLGAVIGGYIGGKIGRWMNRHNWNNAEEVLRGLGILLGLGLGMVATATCFGL